MQKALLFKLLIVAALMAIIGIPLSMIQATISERMAFRDEAVRSIATDSVREQTVVGPVLVIPYTDAFEEREDVSDDKEKKVKVTKHLVQRRALVFPNDLQIKGNMDTDRRYRGIHKVLVYSGQYAIAGDFVLPKLSELARAKPESRLETGRPFIALAIDDVRGIRNIPKIVWGGKTFEFEQGSGLTAFRNGVHAKLDGVDLGNAASVKFAFDLGLDGIERQHFSPVGKNNQVTLASKWPHPQFGGRFLPSPKTRQVDQNGFTATWNISALASNAQQQLIQLESSQAAPTEGMQPDRVDRFNVGFIEPINVYSQADRAVKYGLLFVALTFAAFFLFEILKRLPIHPVQYALVGMSLALFFLLLVSLSEHIEFVYAYLIASSGCVVLIAFYLNHVLRDWRRGLGFGCALTLLYGALYGLLRSENNALVMGSILLFAILAATMVGTRKVDWYQIGREQRAGDALA
jgi:inner membrane protein